jgi:hypothetical protein
MGRIDLRGGRRGVGNVGEDAEVTDYSNLVHRLRTEWDDVEIDCEAADAIEAQAKRIASLQGWMKKLFQYGSSPEAIRNQMTMTTEIPDTLMREGEDILLETPASEKIDE